MKLDGFMKKKTKYAIKTTGNTAKSSVPEGMYVQCPKCKKSVYRADLKVHLGVCPQCGYYYPLSARARISLVVDKGSFQELDHGMGKIGRAHV